MPQEKPGKKKPARHNKSSARLQQQQMVLLILDELDRLIAQDQTMLTELFLLPQVGGLLGLSPIYVQFSGTCRAYRACSFESSQLNVIAYREAHPLSSLRGLHINCRATCCMQLICKLRKSGRSNAFICLLSSSSQHDVPDMQLIGILI